MVVSRRVLQVKHIPIIVEEEVWYTRVICPHLLGAKQIRHH
jgi:hypothetical protein